MFDRSDKLLVDFPNPIGIDFKQLYNQQLSSQGKVPLDESRLSFTLGSAKGTALKDKTKTLADYLAD